LANGPEDMPTPLEGMADAPEDVPAATDEVASKPEDITATAAHAYDVAGFPDDMTDRLEM
jgi:hypothetical protein